MKGDFAFVAPRLAFDSAGTLHIFWGEPANSDLASRMRALELGSVQRILHSIHGKNGWSTPHIAYESSRKLYWTHDFAQVTTLAGRVNVVVADIAVPFSIVRLIADADSVRASNYTTRVTGYPSIAVTSRGDDVVAYMTTDTIEPPAGNSVFAINLSSTSPPSRIQRSVDGAATMLSLKAMGDSIFVLWGQNHAGGLFADGVRYSVSYDAGDTWKTPSSFAREPHGVAHLQMIDTGGCLRTAYITTTDRNQPVVRSWAYTINGWTQHAGPPAIERVRLMAIAADRNRAIVALVADGTLGNSHIWVVAGRWKL